MSEGKIEKTNEKKRNIETSQYLEKEKRIAVMFLAMDDNDS